jgi:hypothetical protein
VIADDARYAMAAATSATIVNLLIGSDLPKSERFQRILFLILEGDRELERLRLEPSEN